MRSLSLPEGPDSSAAPRRFPTDEITIITGGMNDMNTLPQILARYGDGKCPSALQVETVLEASGTDYLEYHGLITNVSDHTVLLERACLADVEDLPGYGLSDGPYLLYRSGRH